MLLVFGSNVAPDLAEKIDGCGWAWKSVPTLSGVDELEPADGWHGALVLPADSAEATMRLCRQLKARNRPIDPLIVMVPPQWSDHLLEVARSSYTFMFTDASTNEFEARLLVALERSASADDEVVLRHEDIVLNVANYQATVSGRTLDLTYMEYELLRYFVSNPDRVFTRAELLRAVWKYEYFGGARTVDVHVRRLRSKIGDDNAQLIQTVRSVGYTFGRSSSD